MRNVYYELYLIIIIATDLFGKYALTYSDRHAENWKKTSANILFLPKKSCLQCKRKIYRKPAAMPCFIPLNFDLYSHKN